MCQNNVLEKIASIPNLDFVLLQEPVLSEFQNNPKWDKLLDSYDYIHHKSGKEDMITLYNKYKYTVSVTKAGEFEYGRPFQMTIFKPVIKGNEKIIIVNLHAPHQELHYLQKLNLFNLDYPIIIGGDFNNPIKNDIIINGINFKNESSIIKQINTCCDHTLNGVDGTKCFDHVLINDKVKYRKVEYPILSVNNIKHSDHLPVYAEIILENDNMFVSGGGEVERKRIGFDFDGVMHKLIISTEENGQRHGDYTVGLDVLIKNRFEKIIDHIKDLQMVNDIKIISSRENQEQVEEFLQDKNLENVDVTVVKDARSAVKTDIVLHEVDEFYDDSANVLREIMIKAKEIGKEIGKEIKLYFVIPELDKWYEVKTEKDIEKKFLKVQMINLIKELQQMCKEGTIDKIDFKRLI
jgi:endonuclease/exonuclease/phosphatase family metal-dependent hydrolase